LEVSDAIATALTIREYDQNKSVPVDSIRKVLDAGRLTSSARNMQPWFFVAVTDKEKLQKLGEFATSGNYLAKSSFCIVIVTDPEKRWHAVDGTRAVQNMTIQAWALGLGTSWIGTFEKDKVKELLNIPKNLDILTLLPFGYPTKKYIGKKDRMTFDQVAFLNSYGNPFSKP
jgi:nitroreductase